MVNSQEVRDNCTSSGSSFFSLDLIPVGACSLVSLGTPDLNVLVGTRGAREELSC